jgi:hypothetical protein
MVARNKNFILEILLSKPGQKVFNFHSFSPVTYITPMNEYITLRQDNSSMTGMSIGYSNKLQAKRFELIFKNLFMNLHY